MKSIMHNTVFCKITSDAYDWSLASPTDFQQQHLLWESHFSRNERTILSHWHRSSTPQNNDICKRVACTIEICIFL